MEPPRQVRRTARQTEPRRHYADQQAWDRQLQEQQQEIARALREAAETEEPSDSSEEDLSSGEGSSSEDEQKARPTNENTAPWTRQLRDIHPPLYTDAPSVQLPRRRPPTELGYLQCFIGRVLVDTVTNTNLYAAARQAIDWTPTTTEEMWRYLAVRIRQGIVVLPELRHYWSNEYRDGYISQLMPRNRFMQLHRYFHIAPPVPRGQRQTVVEKTHTFYHECQALFQQFYTPGCDLALDETMIRFEGRSAWITVIRGKPVSVGYKLFTVASDGYLLGFRIYRGKGGYSRPQSVLHHVVTSLVKPWADVNRRLYFDNLYTSPALCNHLMRMHIRSCGTCRPNRKGLPPDLKQERGRLAKGDTVSWQREQLGCLLWNDSRPVIFLSTYHRPDTLTHIPATDTRPGFDRPTVAVDYNKHKSHVDRIDQLRSYYVVERRGRRTWPALAWWLLDTCISNAYALWCLDRNVKPGLLHFREQLLQQIAAAYPSQRTRVQPGVPAVNRAPFVGHWPTESGTRGNCVQCSYGRDDRHKVTAWCAVCEEHLHPVDCFGAYHDGQQIDNRRV